ncbi:hydantoinase B/oxoprolinase family protein [Acuticoccus sp. I52.16.1]|uniref:hydantoinase B/oxoprolinase family protein n=1 Tax=Acuticoccus sp. I52.16.1 TaxID=2928472 RepID=UPI001FD1F782|nr:hydantoinase B/oxoprolinase family protein [Acuticoccus sp. I52.16.1]UOM34093.1 hydantoinase B/oxoprolinase family protein [Acuticoccus sp. I52.16.1]
MTPTFDAVDLSILWERLVSITDEGATALIRTSFSTLVREGFDLSVLIFDADARMIAQSTKCIPVFIGTAPITLSHMLRKFPGATLDPGDVVISNDPTIGTGHMYDLAVMRPIFRNGTLAGYAMSITHLPDIGGMGFSVSATEIYHEGLRLPITKLVKKGVLDDDLMELIKLNVRVPDQVAGDIFANISCTSVVVRHVLEFMDEYGLASLTPLADEILAQSENAVRQALLAMPDAEYTSRAQVEAYDEVRTLRCRVVKAGDRLTVDFEGTGPCVGAGINVPFPYTRAMALYALKCITTPGIPNNDGATALIDVVAPVGSILAAVPPAPSAGRHTIGHFVVPLIFDAMARIVPDRVTAASGLIDIMTFQGRHDDGREMAANYFVCGGFGGLQGMDGRQTTPGSSNMGTTPIEVFEPLSGLVVEEKSLLADSGGAGAFRGGAGQTVVMRNGTARDMVFFAMANRTMFAAEGLFGGRPGARRRHMIDGVEVDGQGRHVLVPGAELRLEQAGGGGYGPPDERPTTAIARDIDDGFLTPEGAVASYGPRAAGLGG